MCFFIFILEIIFFFFTIILFMCFFILILEIIFFYFTHRHEHFHHHHFVRLLCFFREGFGSSKIKYIIVSCFHVNNILTSEFLQRKYLKKIILSLQHFQSKHLKNHDVPNFLNNPIIALKCIVYRLYI